MTAEEAFEMRLEAPLHPTDGRLFVDKAFQLVQVLIDNGREKDAFQTLVLLKSVVRICNPRMQDLKLRGIHAILDTLIRAFVAREPNSHGARYRLARSLHADFIMDLSGVSWRPGRRHAWYWDFSTAAKTLDSVYFERRCARVGGTSNADRDLDERSGCCIHSTSIELLDWLQTKAWSEIRNNVFQTIGTLLPTELTERIFEYALDVEKISHDPKLVRYVRVNPPKLPMGHSASNPSGHPVHFRKRINLLHCCPVMWHHMEKGPILDLGDLPLELCRRYSAR
jgi:hypothetical protein